MSNPGKEKKLPPKEAIKSVQFDLFSRFITNNKAEVSNAIEVWESIPKYFLTPAQVEKLRTKEGYAGAFRWEYSYKGIACEVKIQPALIQQPDGNDKAFFPGLTEELVEEALKKALAEQQSAVHDPEKAETWVRFSLSSLAGELKRNGCTRNRAQIKHAIEIMSACVITLSKNGQEVWKGSILQDLVTVGRAEYREDTNAQHVARLPLFISHAVNQLEYRQFNYERLMSCSTQLSRWLYKLFINRYRQASHANDYHFMFSGVENSSGLLQRSRLGDNRRKVVDALDELVKNQVLTSYEVVEQKDRRKTVDVKYIVKPSSEFITEQKASNKRATDNHLRALQAGVQINR